MDASIPFPNAENVMPTTVQPPTRSRFTRHASAIAAWTIGVVGAAHAAPPRAADFVPDNVFVALTLRDGDHQATALRETIEQLGVYETAAYELISTTPEFMQAQVGLAGIASAAKLDGWGAIGATIGREAVAAIAPGELHSGRPNVVLVIVPREPAIMDRLLEIGQSMAGLTRRGEPDAARSRKVGDHIVYQLAPELCFCRTPEALVIANNGEFLTTALQCGTTGRNRLSETKIYREAEGKTPTTALAWAMIDSPRLKTALHDGEEPPDKINNPLGGFLFGGWWHALRAAESAVAWIESKPQAIHAHIEVISNADLPATHRGFAAPSDRPAAWNERGLPRFLGSITIDRDWRALFAERESLLTLSAAGDVVNFSNTLTTILGIDFLEELLPAVNGSIRLIAVRPDFSKLDYLPSPRLPSFALAIPLKLDAAGQMARRLNSGSQTALSLVNADAMQKGEPTYLLDMDRYRDVRLVFADFPRETSTGTMMQDVPPPPGESSRGKTGVAAPEERPSSAENPMTSANEGPTTRPGKPRRVGMRYNFAMAAAVVGNEYVVATSRDLLERIIDVHLDNQPRLKKDAAGSVDSLVFEARSIVALLRDNREELVTQRMLEQDRTRKHAEQEIDAFLELAAFGDGVEISTSTKGRTYSADLTMRVSRPVRSEAAR
ncbi:MAG: hypothetical protein JNG88_05225 [Phycisphaerales bacterium]|nr:hypothetical protein [Phycisphaerales bacterium]